MRHLGVILFFVGIGLIVWMFFMGNSDFASGSIHSRSELKLELFFTFNRQLFALLGSTLAICGTLMSIFCNLPSHELKECKACDEIISVNAKKCKHCHEWVGGDK